MPAIYTHTGVSRHAKGYFSNAFPCPCRSCELKQNAEAINFGRYAKENLPKTYRIWNQMKTDNQISGEESILNDQQKFYLEKELRER